MSQNAFLMAIELAVRVMSDRAAVMTGLLAALGLFIVAVVLQTWMALAAAGGFAVVVFWPLLIAERRRSSGE
jgi:hypothetical protein